MKRGLNQDILKGLACLSMLLDHIGAVFLPMPWLRIVGRLAFPLYCYLLCQGMTHTRNFRRYLTRLAGLALLSEVPFDLLFYGKLTFAHQNVLFTLIISLLSGKIARNTNGAWRLAIAMLGVMAAELCRSDYGGMGVLLILTMALTEDRRIWAAMMAAIFLLMGGVQIFGLLAMLPICLCSGQRTGRGQRWMNWFYPAHMTLLLLVEILCNLNFPLT